MSNVVPLFDKQNNNDIDYYLQHRAFSSLIKSGKFLLVHELENGEVRYHSGDKMTLGNLAYFLKVVNIRTDNLISDSMYPGKE